MAYRDITVGLTPSEFISKVNYDFAGLVSSLDRNMTTSQYLALINGGISAFNAAYGSTHPSLTLGKNTVSPVTNLHNLFSVTNDLKNSLSARQLTYLRQHAGLIIHWGMATFGAKEWSDYNLAVDTFNPSGIDIDNWLDTAVTAGFKYAVFTSKHHEGFAMWPTQQKAAGYDPYSIAQTTWYANNSNYDIVGNFITKCRAKGLRVGLYFSIQDGTFNTRIGGITSSNFPPYIKAQLTELLTNYGDIDIIWFDGWTWWAGMDAIVDYTDIYNHIIGLQPNITIVDNAHSIPNTKGYIDTYEADLVPPADNATICERVVSGRNNGNWFWHSGASQLATDYRTAAQISAEIATANSRKAAYLYNISPSTAGVLPTIQNTILSGIVI